MRALGIRRFSQQIVDVDFLSRFRFHGKFLRCISDRDFAGVVRKIKRDAAGGVAGGVNHLRLERAPAERITFFQKLIDFDELGRLNAEERGLHFHGSIERQVVAMHEHGRAGVLMELAQAADVINVRVGADDGFHGEAVAPEEIQDARDFIAGVDDQSFARVGIADNGTIALEHAHRDGDVNQTFRGGIQRGKAIVHEGDYSIGSEWGCWWHSVSCGAL